jgi:hypothetical protein
MASVIAAQVLGQISWNLPATLQYTPGTPIPVEVQIGNPTDTNRNYQLVEQVLQDSSVISEEVVPIDSENWLPVPAGYVVTLQGTISLDVTNVIYRLNLKEQSTGNVVGYVAVALAGPGTPPAPAPDFMGPMMGMMGMALMAGVLVPTVTRMMKPEE